MKAINNQLNSTFTFNCENENGNSIFVTMNSQVREMSSFFKTLFSKDHVFAIVDQELLRNNKVLGSTKGLFIRLASGLIDKTLNNENTATIAHEVGHSAGLLHPNKFPVEGLKDISHNLMLQTKTAEGVYGINRNLANKLEWPQVKIMIDLKNIPEKKKVLPISDVIWSVIRETIRNK